MSNCGIIYINMKFKLPAFKLPHIDKPGNKRERILLVALIVCSLYIYVGLGFAWNIYLRGSLTENTKKIVKVFPFPAGRVGTTFIPLSRYLRDYFAIARYIEATGTGEQYAQLKLEQDVMDRLVEASVIERIAHRNNIKVTREEVDAAYNQAATEEQEPVERVLDQYFGFTPEDYKVWIAETLLKEKVINTIPQKREIYQILFFTEPGATDATVKDKEEQAKKALEEIKNGAKFEDVAKKDSNDLSTRDNGGLLGLVSRGGSRTPIIDKAFEEAAFNAPLNEVIGPIRSSRGWHLIKVTKQEGAEPVSPGELIDNEKAKLTISNWLPHK